LIDYSYLNQKCFGTKNFYFNVVNFFPFLDFFLDNILKFLKLYHYLDHLNIFFYTISAMV
jgi:hypothetical protein